MYIQVRGSGGPVTGQMRAYAEYRLFAELVRFDRTVRSATISLEPTAPGDSGVTCVVEVDLGTQGRVRSHATEPHAADAVERAASRARSALERRLRQAVFR